MDDEQIQARIRQQSDPRHWAAKVGIAKRFQKSLDDYDLTRGSRAAHLAATEMDDDLEDGGHEGFGLTLVGPPGRGKTLLAGILAWQHLLRNTAPQLGVSWWDYEPPVLFTTLAQYQIDLLEEIKLDTMWSKHSGDDELFVAWNAARDKIERLREVELLVLDDVGHERASSTMHIEKAFEHLIRTRYDLEKPTIVTSNLKMKEFFARHGEPLVSFLHESSRVVGVPGNDNRVLHAQYYGERV